MRNILINKKGSNVSKKLFFFNTIQLCSYNLNKLNCHIVRSKYRDNANNFMVKIKYLSWVKHK